VTAAADVTDADYREPLAKYDSGEFGTRNPGLTSDQRYRPDARMASASILMTGLAVLGGFAGTLS
jgi:hypothetical protein